MCILNVCVQCTEGLHLNFLYVYIHQGLTPKPKILDIHIVIAERGRDNLLFAAGNLNFHCVGLPYMFDSG